MQPNRKHGLTFAEFVAKYKNEFLLFGEPIPLSQMLRARPTPARPSPREPTISISSLKREFKRWWPCRMLETAVKENCPQACGLALGLLLQKMGIELRRRLSISSSRPTGRPRSQDAFRIFITWTNIGKPSVYRRTLAHAVYGKKFTSADRRARKKMVDQCRQAVQREIKRRQEPDATKSHSP